MNGLEMRRMKLTLSKMLTIFVAVLTVTWSCGAAEERPWRALISRTDPELHRCAEFKEQKPMPWLAVRGTRIVDSQDREIRLGGIALPISDDPAWSDYPMHGTKLLQYYAGLGCNAIRISFNINTAQPFEQYVDEMIEPLVKAAKEFRCYLILDMHEYKYGSLEGGAKGPKPDFEATLLERWRYLAGRYRNESAIAAYELWNEPDLLDGGRQDINDHRLYLTKLIRAVRRIDPRHILIVNGVLGGFGPTTALTWGENYHYDGAKAMKSEKNWLTPTGIKPVYDSSVPEIRFERPEQWEHPDPEKNMIFAFHCGHFLANVQNASLEYHIANHRNILACFAKTFCVPVMCTEWECEPPDTAGREFMQMVADWFREDRDVAGWLIWRVHLTREYMEKYYKEFRSGGYVRPGELDPAYADIWLPLTAVECRRP